MGIAVRGCHVTSLCACMSTQKSDLPVNNQFRGVFDTISSQDDIINDDHFYVNIQSSKTRLVSVQLVQDIIVMTDELLCIFAGFMVRFRGGESGRPRGRWEWQVASEVCKLTRACVMGEYRGPDRAALFTIDRSIIDRLTTQRIVEIEDDRWFHAALNGDLHMRIVQWYSNAYNLSYRNAKDVTTSHTLPIGSSIMVGLRVLICNRWTGQCDPCELWGVKVASSSKSSQPVWEHPLVLHSPARIRISSQKF